MPIVSMLWIGERLSALESLSIRSHLAHGYEVELYCYAPIDGVPDGTRLCDAREILPADSIFSYQQGPGRGSVAAFANLFRYKLLFERGGRWSDTDVVCLRDADATVGEIFFASERLEPPENLTLAERLRWEIRAPSVATNCVLKAPRDNPVMERCYREAARADPAKLNWGDTGPALLGRVIAELGQAEHLVPAARFCPVDWWCVPELLKQGLSRPTSAAGVHLWNEMWRRAGLDKDATYPTDSLYEQLKRQYGAS